MVSLFSPIPRIGYVPQDHYTLAMYALGGTHNLLSLFVLISYFLSNHPRLPTKEEVKAPFRYGQCVLSIDANCNILSVVASNGHDFGQILFIFFLLLQNVA